MEGLGDAAQYYRARVEKVSDYYPFGLEMGGRTVNSPTYRYGFNGKEKEKIGGITQYDYGFRICHPSAARFLSVDPLFKSYPMLTPYQFASNSPIKFIDLDGLEAARHGADESRGIDAEMADKIAREELGLYRITTGSPTGVNFENSEEALIHEASREKTKSNRGFWNGVIEIIGMGTGNGLVAGGAGSLAIKIGSWFSKRARPAVKIAKGAMHADDLLTPLAASTGISRPSVDIEDVPIVTSTNNKRQNVGAKYSGKFEIDDTFIEGVDNLKGNIDLGWYDGETAFVEISNIFKAQNYSGSVFKNLVTKIESIAAEAGLKEVQIQFQIVINSRLANDPTWAKQYGYNFYQDLDDLGTTRVTWTKQLE